MSNRLFALDDIDFDILDDARFNTLAIKGQGILPQNLADELMNDLLPPNGVWSDFHCDLRHWEGYYVRLVLTGLISIDDMPPKPKVSGFSSDLTTPRSHCDGPPYDL